MSDSKKKIVIVGGGFGGINAAQGLKNSSFEITIIDKTNHHLFQPLLYQVATAALSPADIAMPIRTIFTNNRNIKIIMAEVLFIDRENKFVGTTSSKINFDYLILAPGTRHSYYGKPEWEKIAPGLKTLNDALIIRENILNSLEEAEKLNDKESGNQYLTFVIIGGGPTGVELAGAIAEIAKQTMIKDFRIIKADKTRVILIEGSKRILSSYPNSLSQKAKVDLEKLGVEVIVELAVEEIGEDYVRIHNKIIQAKNIIWAAGNEAPGFLKSLNTDMDNAGRVLVNKDCSIPNYENIFVIGDAAALRDKTGNFLPGVAPVAIQQGKYVARIILEEKRHENRQPFSYLDKGNLATIGKAKAIAEIRGLKFSGFIAWLIWSFVHILFLIGYRNRFRVMAEWIWKYVTNQNGIRLIVGKVKNG